MNPLYKVLLQTRFQTQMVLVGRTDDQVPHVQITFFLKHPGVCFQSDDALKLKQRNIYSNNHLSVFLCI